ncbi:MAG: hypothetical protein FRX49_08090 [Trebouxia sp. A1-2]|nr:MAG: hypothetical protein FRX49_08090 [Trebouxia sp. A1-2]
MELPLLEGDPALGCDDRFVAAALPSGKCSGVSREPALSLLAFCCSAASTADLRSRTVGRRTRLLPSRLTHLRVYGLKAEQILVSESLFSRAPPGWIKGQQPTQQIATMKSMSRAKTYPSEGVLGLPWIANMGATCSWGVEAAPKPATLCSSSPKMHPRDHKSIALSHREGREGANLRSSIAGCGHDPSQRSLNASSMAEPEAGT